MSTSSYLSSRFAPIQSFLSGSLGLARTSWSVVSSCHPPDDRLEADLTLTQHACLSLLKGVRSTTGWWLGCQCVTPTFYKNKIFVQIGVHIKL
jgi:hypothetical protein